MYWCEPAGRWICVTLDAVPQMVTAEEVALVRLNEDVDAEEGLSLRALASDCEREAGLWLIDVDDLDHLARRYGADLDDHFANRCAAAIGLGKTGCLRQAGKSPPVTWQGCPSCQTPLLRRLHEPRYTKSLAGSYPSPLHAASLWSFVARLIFAARSQRSAVQSSSCQRVRLQSQHRRSVAHALSPARSRWSARCSTLRSATELFPPTNNSKSSRWPPAKPASMIASPVNGASTTSPPTWSTATPTKR